MSRTTQENANRSATEAYQELIESLTGMEQTLASYSDVVEAEDPNARILREIAASVRNDGSELLERGRLLRLGVVGQVKAGKSSLLNVLLFDGEEVLPKAATPMTASLTHIVKSDRAEVEIEYYSRADWNEVKKYADHYRKESQTRSNGSNDAPSSRSREPAEYLRASHELVETAKDKRIDVERYLDTKICHPASIDTLNQMLRNLVGAEGGLTPLVKSVTIACSQGFPDIDIVDTPGINDPIVSRSRKTRKLLGRCDAVLLLSYAGQFMDSEDARFFQERIPAEGIERKLLLASKYDSALVDEAQAYRGNLDEALCGLQANLSGHAINTDIGVSEDDMLFVSPMCARLSRRPPGDWSTDERETFENLRKAYPDWFDPAETEATEPTKATLRSIGNQDGVDECIEAIRRNKDSIIDKKMRDFLEEKKRGMERELAEVADDLRVRRDELRGGDISDLNARIAEIHEVIDGIKAGIEEAWEDAVDSQRKSLRKLVDDIRREAKEAKEEVRDAKSERNAKREKGGIFWKLTRFLCDVGHEEYTEEVVNRDKLQEAVENLAQNLEFRLGETAGDLFSNNFIGSATKRVNSIVADGIPNDVASGVNIRSIRSTLRRTIKLICHAAREAIKNAIPDLDAHALGSSQFVDTDSVQSQSEARKVVAEVVDQAVARVRSVENEIDLVMEQSKDVYPAIIEELESQSRRIKSDLEHREFQLQRYDLALDAFERCAEEVAR